MTRQERGKPTAVEQAMPLISIDFSLYLPKSLPLTTHASGSLAAAGSAPPATRMKMETHARISAWGPLAPLCGWAFAAAQRDSALIIRANKSFILQSFSRYPARIAS
jgi:hypothetical protein